jgi:hypothetical protein
MGEFFDIEYDLHPPNRSCATEAHIHDPLVYPFIYTYIHTYSIYMHTYVTAFQKSFMENKIMQIR